MSDTPETDALATARIDPAVNFASAQLTNALNLCAKLERRLREAEKDAKSRTDTIRKIEQALLPDPHDEREVSVEWLRKTIRAAIEKESRNA